MLISWSKGVSGDFARASNWSPSLVPGPVDDVLIGAKGSYTITSSTDEIVNNVAITQKNATLLISGATTTSGTASTFSDSLGGINDGTIVVKNSSRMIVGTITSNTTLSNVGTIDLDDSSLQFGPFGPFGDIVDSLIGGGQINLSGGEIVGGVMGITVVSDNRISGTGTIDFSAGGQEAHGDWINQGIVDASTPNKALNVSHTIVDNSNLLKATNGGLLNFLVAPIHNTTKGVIEATGEKSEVTLGDNLESVNDINAGLITALHSGTVVFQDVFSLDNTYGKIAAGRGSAVDLEDASIDGGLITILRGGFLQSDLHGSVGTPSTITGAVMTNAGTIGAEGANLTINGDVASTGTLDANNATLAVDGAVSGGKATLEGTGEIEFGGPSAARVTFAANSNAMLKLDDPLKFTGTIFGLTTGDSLDLTNINFADSPTISYSKKTHVLSVTDSVSQITDTITLKNVSGSFTALSDGNGGTLITDPPPSMTAIWHQRDAAFTFASNLGEGADANFSGRNCF
jgi:hypothetical protein